mgnify:CR=1 FL=1
MSSNSSSTDVSGTEQTEASVAAIPTCKMIMNDSNEKSIVKVIDIIIFEVNRNKMLVFTKR